MKTIDFVNGGYTETTITETPITISCAKNSASTAPGLFSNGLRIYYSKSQGASITFNIASGYKLTQIDFTYSDNKSFPSNVQTTGSFSNGIWKAGSLDVTSVSFYNTQSTNNQVIISKVDITYEKISGGGQGETDPDGDVYEIVKSLSDITIDGDYIWITSTGNKIYGMSNSAASSKFTGTEISGDLNGEIVVKNEDVQILNVSSIDGNSVVWKNGSQYLLGQNNGTNLTLSNTPTACTLDISNSGISKIIYPVSNTTNRMILYNDNGSQSLFGHYAQSNANTSGYYDVYICKKKEGGLPSIPVVTLNGTNLDNGGSQKVLVDTPITLNITSRNAESIVINDDEYNIENVSYIYNIDTSSTGEISLSILGRNEEGDGPEFTYKFIVDVKEEVPSVGSNFKQMLNGEALSEGYYVIAKVNGTEEGTVNYAMKNELSNGNIISTSQISAQPLERGGNLITTENEEVLVVKLVDQNGQLGLKTVNFGDGFSTSQGYIYAVDESSITLDIANEFKQVFIGYPQGSNNININFAPELSRKIVLASNNNYFNYQTNGTIQLYQYTSKKVFDPQFTEQRLKGGDTYNIVLPEDAPENITFTVEGNTDGITLDGTKITAKAYISSDPATIVATWEEDENYFAGSAKFDVTVLFKAELEFRHGIDEFNPIRGKIGVGVLSQAVYYTGNGTVIYSSSDPAEVVVNPNTGMIRPVDVAGAKTGKTYKITARVDGDTDSYLENSEAVYFIKFEEPEIGKVTEIVTFDFTKDTYGAGPAWNGNNNTMKYVTTANVATQDGVKVTFTPENNDTENGPWRFWSDGLRAYNKNNPIFTVSVDEGKIKAISFTGENGATFKLNDGKSTQNITTWTGEEESVSFAYTGTSNNALKTITVEYEIDGGNGADLKFDDSDRIINIFAGEEYTLPKLSHNSDLNFGKLDFDIDEIDEFDDNSELVQNYSIARDNEKEEIKITVNDPGIYTFRAEYDPKNDEGSDILKGMAILRLNVFPRLNIVPSDDHDSSLAGDDRTELPQLTLVEPAVNENGSMEAKITMPNLSQLNNDYKYSTVSIDKVTVVHGDETTVYAKPSDVAAVAEGYVQNIDDLPETLIFTKDGSVSYTMVYANTTDFSIDETVHVVMMPQLPDYELIGEDDTLIPDDEAYKNGGVKKVKITRVNDDTYGKTQVYVYTIGGTDDSNNEGDPLPAKRRVDANFNMALNYWATEGDGYNFDEDDDPNTITISAPENGQTKQIYFSTVKTLPEGVYNGDDQTLRSSSTGYIVLDSTGNTETGIEAIGAEDAEVRYFTPQGIQVSNPQHGQIYIVVKGNKAYKVLF